MLYYTLTEKQCQESRLNFFAFYPLKFMNMQFPFLILILNQLIQFTVTYGKGIGCPV